MSKKDPYHLNGALHITGKSTFIGDMNNPANTLCAKMLVSPHAHAQILSLDTKTAKAYPGVKAILTASDIPGVNQIGHPITDQPLFPTNKVTHIGQPIALVIADNEKIANHALTLIEINYKELKPILTIDEAINARKYFAPERKIERGDISAALAKSDFVIESSITTGTQEHLYLETQRAVAIPGDDNNITLYSSTQSPTAIQEITAQVLGINSKDVTVDVKRLGGGFGGKEGGICITVASLAALGAHLTKQPVELTMSRIDDMNYSGKRHPFLGKYKIGFNKDGKINAYDLKLYSNGGAFADLSMSVLERGMLLCDNTYYFPNIRILGYACKTNLPPNTAFRGFGAPQGIFVTEAALAQIAQTLEMDPLLVRQANLYKAKQKTPYGQIINEPYAKEAIDSLANKYKKAIAACKKFNKTNKYIKRGVCLLPMKFGISFTASFLNQASSLIWIYADGSVSLSHGAVEMGQEVNTKIAQVVAHELGISLDTIRVESANTKRVGNTSPTAASTGSDINGHAAHDAAIKLKKRLVPVAKVYLADKYKTKVDNVTFANNKIFATNDKKIFVAFSELAHYAWFTQTDLGAHGFYKTPDIWFDRESGVGQPFHYFVYGACLAQVEVDILCGNHKLCKIDIAHEAADPINCRIDEGQIYGAFAQGYGWCTMEEMEFDDKGKYLASTPSTYKIPTISDMPEEFNVKILKSACKEASVLGSKAVGEPPFIYGQAVYFAIKNAIESIDDFKTEAKLNIPATAEAIMKAVEVINNN